MPRNPIQFQHGMSMNEFIAAYGTEAQCEAALQQARWPDGFVCPECGAHEHCTFVADGRRYWQCLLPRPEHPALGDAVSCFAAASGNLVSGHLPGHPEQELHLGAVAQAPPWGLLAHRLAARPLVGVVVADDAYLGGVRTGGKRGRGSENKVPFIAAVELDPDGHPQHVRFDPLPDLKATSVVDWAGKALDPTVHLVTDGLASLGAAAEVVAAYGAIIVTPHRASDLDPFHWVNTFIANLKTAIRGTYHHFKFRKYPRRYLAEAQYRVNRGFELRSLVGRLVYTCANTAPCPEVCLRLGVARAG